MGTAQKNNNLAIYQKCNSSMWPEGNEKQHEWRWHHELLLEHFDLVASYTNQSFSHLVDQTKQEALWILSKGVNKHWRLMKENKPIRSQCKSFSPSLMIENLEIFAYATSILYSLTWFRWECDISVFSLISSSSLRKQDVQQAKRSFFCGVEKCIRMHSAAVETFIFVSGTWVPVNTKSPTTISLTEVHNRRSEVFCLLFCQEWEIDLSLSLFSLSLSLFHSLSLSFSSSLTPPLLFFSHSLRSLSLFFLPLHLLLSTSSC